MGLEAALTWKTCTFGLTKKLPYLDSFIYKKLLNYTAIFGGTLFGQLEIGQLFYAN